MPSVPGAVTGARGRAMIINDQFNLLLWAGEVRRIIEACGVERARLSLDFVRRAYFGGMTAWEAARAWGKESDGNT